MKHFLSTLRVLTLLLALVIHHTATAQTAGRRTSIILQGNALQYQGDFGSDYWKLDQSQYAPGIGLNQYLTKGLDLTTQVLYGELKGQRSPTKRFTTTLINANLGFKLKLNNGWALKENARFQPYLLAASGWTFASRANLADTNRVEENKNYVDLMAGAGINVRLSDGLSFFVQTSQHLPVRANLDGTPEPTTPRWADRFLQHTFGLAINLGQAPDADEDGVPDGQDKCPDTSGDVEVDARGCPMDDDQDGVPNHLDQCPEQAGTAATQGCPDADQDGVDDTDDVCPDKPGKVELRGCPDTDNDGITDTEDKCPDTPAGAVVDGSGCSEPGAAPTADASPTDTDGDGIANADDRCPDSPGPATNRGCPEIKAEARQRLKEATKFIGFELNKATLLTSSYPTLDAIAQLLREYPDYSLSIAGHTDSQGPAAYNLRLSRERAAAARSYLLGQGLTEARIELRGYGARHPLTSNTTAAGRTQNRRVEFDLFLTGDTNAAQAKYGAEPSSSAPIAPAKSTKKAPAKKVPAKKKGASGKKPMGVRNKPTSTRTSTKTKSTKSPSSSLKKPAKPTRK